MGVLSAALTTRPRISCACSPAVVVRSEIQATAALTFVRCVRITSRVTTSGANALLLCRVTKSDLSPASGGRRRTSQVPPTDSYENAMIAPFLSCTYPNRESFQNDQQ